MAAVKRTIIFEDDGQDFLEWDLDEAGLVVDCRPFQAAVWVGASVFGPHSLRPGSAVKILSKSGHVLTLTHRVQEVK